MAVKRVTIEHRSSDLSGEEADGVRRISATIDGKGFRLDLTPAEVATLEGLLAPYFEAFENVKAGNGGAAPDENADIRAWGRDHGYDVQERGKLSASLKKAYWEAQEADEEAPAPVKASKASK